jgi:hypothetical protein
MSGTLATLRFEAGCPAGGQCAKECYMGILDELLIGGQRQKEYGDFVKRYEQGDRPRATPIKRF